LKRDLDNREKSEGIEEFKKFNISNIESALLHEKTRQAFGIYS
jgi:hypothetical protein